MIKKKRQLTHFLIAVFLLLVSPIIWSSDRIFCSRFESVACTPLTDSESPLVFSQEPAIVFVAPGQLPIIGANILDSESGVNASSIQLFLDGQNVSDSISFDAVAGKLRFSPKNAPSVGQHTVRLKVKDVANNETDTSWNFRVSTVPEITSVAPLNIQVEFDNAKITANFSDASEEIDPASIELLVNNNNVTANSVIKLTSPRAGTIEYRFPQPIVAGAYAATFQIANKQFAGTSKSWDFWILAPESIIAEVVSPATNFVSTVPLVNIAIRALSNRAYVSGVLVGGIQARAGPYDGTNAPLFEAQLKLIPGLNTIPVIVGFEDGETRTINYQITYDAPPQIKIVSPVDLQIFGPIAPTTNAPGGALALTGAVERPIAISGTLDRQVAQVQINQQAAVLSPDGRSFTFANYFAREGVNLITAVATDASGRVGLSNITIYVDQTGPIVAVEGPSNNSVTSANQLDIRGVVNDAVEAGANAPEPVVQIKNIANGQVVTAQTNDRYFVAKNIPIEVGANDLEVKATDSAGNFRLSTLRVSRVAVGSKRITLLDGNHQSASVSTTLATPLTVSAIDETGNAIGNIPVRFDVVRGAGSISTLPNAPVLIDGINPARNLEVTTDQLGIAKVWLTLGSQTGVGANAVRASNVSIAEDALFIASGQRGSPEYTLVEGASSAQFAHPNSQPLEPLSAVVYDAKFNRAINVPVRFTVLSGDAKFTASSAPGGVVSEIGKILEVPTDKNGIAAARPQLGDAPGSIKISAKALGAPETALAAVFQINTLLPQTGPTKLGGVVLDHRGTPLAGVRFSIARTNLSVTSDSAGKFQFLSQVPPGKIDLFVDGRTVQTQPNQQYPALHFETTIVRGQSNQLPHAIYLPPINLLDAKVVGGPADVSMTMAGYEGFEMIVKAGSVTFPDGSRVGPLVISPVHNDRLPMVPPGGGSTFGTVAWTIQPTGTRFDPPIQVKIPSPGGMPRGTAVSLVQWDHDLAMFVPIGRATVSEDGAQIVSDVGSGISKAGWGGCAPGTCPPTPPNCSTDSDGPKPPVNYEVKAKQLERHWFTLFISVMTEVDLDKIQQALPVDFRLIVSPRGCDEVSYKWLDFGDGGVGFGNPVEHEYEDGGEGTLKVDVTCQYTKCTGLPGFSHFPHSTAVRVIDGRWALYVSELGSCGWAPGCWLANIAQVALGEISSALSTINVSWLQDAKNWFRETLDRAGQSGTLGEGEIALAATLYAVNEVFFPESLLDFPMGHSIKAVGLVKKQYGASANEVSEFAEQIKRFDCGRSPDNNAALTTCPIKRKLAWERFEKQGLIKVKALTPSTEVIIEAWKPVRNTNNGFDGIVITREVSTGRIRARILESKCWALTTRNCEARDLTAFGFGADASTLDRNIVTVLSHPALDNLLTVKEIIELRGILNRRDFQIIIHTLHESKKEEAEITAAIKNLTRKEPIYIEGW